mmetsp:Transcript_32976/g.77339  ORF Transcript_32976/g.77339 Transcript_32976/m.77339 type:complete len:239 (+) Transcript_32976:725-1441(+)
MPSRSRPGCPAWPGCGWTPSSPGPPRCRRWSTDDAGPPARPEPALRPHAGAGRRDAGAAGRPHAGPDRARRGRQVQPAVADRRRTRAAGWAAGGAGRRHGLARPPRARLPAHRLHAARPGPQPLPDAVGGGEPAVLRPPVRPRRGRTAPAHRRALRQHRAAALSGAAGRQALGRHEAEAGPVLRADPRPRPADPRRAHHRRGPAVARAVLAADRPHPRAAAGHERHRRHRLHGGGRGL